MQQPAGLRFSQGMKSRLTLAVPYVFNDQQRCVEKHLLSFGLQDSMFVRTLSAISVIPIETFKLIETDHFCIFV